MPSGLTSQWNTYAQQSLPLHLALPFTEVALHRGTEGDGTFEMSID